MLNEPDLLELLKEKGVDFQIHNHEPLFTVEDSEKLRGEIIGAHTKNLFLKNKKGDFFLFSCDENASVDLKSFSKATDAKNISFANENYLNDILGIKPGSVSPLALFNDTENIVSFYLDEKLARSKLINFHPLINTKTITLETKDFLNLFIKNNKKGKILFLEDYSIVDIL